MRLSEEIKVGISDEKKIVIRELLAGHVNLIYKFIVNDLNKEDIEDCLVDFDKLVKEYKKEEKIDKSKQINLSDSDFSNKIGIYLIKHCSKDLFSLSYREFNRLPLSDVNKIWVSFYGLNKPFFLKLEKISGGNVAIDQIRNYFYGIFKNFNLNSLKKDSISQK